MFAINTFVEFLFEKVLWTVLCSAVIFGFVTVTVIVLHNRITYRLYSMNEYYAYRNNLDRIEWEFNSKNADRVQELMKEILLDHNMVLDENTGYKFKFVENTFDRLCYNVYVSEHYGEGKILVKNIMIPQSLIPRIEIYEEWF